MTIRVSLSDSERRVAYHVAVERREFHIVAGDAHAYNRPRDAAAVWDDEVAGALGEMACAKYTGLYWDATPKREHRIADVGGLIDVRSVYRRANDRLMLHKPPKDPEDRPFVLALVRPTNVDLIGWLFAHEGKREEWFEDPTREGRPAYFVPRTFPPMRPMASLLDWVTLNPPPMLPGILEILERRTA